MDDKEKNDVFFYGNIDNSVINNIISVVIARYQ